MEFAQEVRRRRIDKMREFRDSRTGNEILQVFERILNILDEATKKDDFDGVEIYAGDRIGKRYTIEVYGLCDWYRASGELIVPFQEPIYPYDFLISLKNYINSEEGFIAEFSKYAPNVVELHINIK
ncbi:MAG: hypothetical protein IJ220_09010 [Clostridia bacterium]|nr:hypothetical protein [Clostridia bacterium]